MDKGKERRVVTQQILEPLIALFSIPLFTFGFFDWCLQYLLFVIRCVADHLSVHVSVVCFLSFPYPGYALRFVVYIRHSLKVTINGIYKQTNKSTQDKSGH
jgi:hypothetical protein